MTNLLTPKNAKKLDNEPSEPSVSLPEDSIPDSLEKKRALLRGLSTVIGMLSTTLLSPRKRVQATQLEDSLVRELELLQVRFQHEEAIIKIGHMRKLVALLKNEQTN